MEPRRRSGEHVHVGGCGQRDDRQRRSRRARMERRRAARLRNAPHLLVTEDGLLRLERLLPSHRHVAARLRAVQARLRNTRHLVRRASPALHRRDSRRHGVGVSAAPLQAWRVARSRPDRRRKSASHVHGQFLIWSSFMRTFLMITLLMLSIGTTAEAGTIEMKVNGLVCGFCAQGIEKTLRKNPATADVVVSLENKLVAIETREGQDIPDAVLKKALSESGYDVKAIERTTTPIAEIRARVEGKPK